MPDTKINTYTHPLMDALKQSQEMDTIYYLGLFTDEETIPDHKFVINYVEYGYCQSLPTLLIPRNIFNSRQAC